MSGYKTRLESKWNEIFICLPRNKYIKNKSTSVFHEVLDTSRDNALYRLYAICVITHAHFNVVIINDNIYI